MDRISNLPDEILLHIISHLPCKDIVATFLLSTRWKSLSTFLPIHDLECKISKHSVIDVLDDDTDTLLALQRRVREIPDDGRIRKIRIEYPARENDDVMLLSTLISQVVRHKIEEFDLDILYGHQVKPVSLHSLLTSESLTSLKLTMVQYEFPTSICLPCLKTLHLQDIKFMKEHYAEQLISGCPVLEELLLYFEVMNNPHSFAGQHRVSIASATLQRLTVSAVDENGRSSYCSLKIDSSSVQSLKLSCGNFKIVLSNLISLTEADLNIIPYEPYHAPYGNPNPNCVRELLERICHVKSLQLSNLTLQFISGFKVDNLPKFHNLTHLEVDSRRTYPNRLGTVELMNILQMSLNLHL